MLEQLKQIVYNANQDLLSLAPVQFSWVSVSAIDRRSGLVVLMPDGGALTAEDMALVDLQGNVIEGREPPVIDAAVHLALYKAFPNIGSVAHPYSRWATVFAQLDMPIPTLGAIHAGTFAADVPVTSRIPGEGGVAGAIADTFRENDLTPEQVPAILVTGQGAYTFGEDARSAVNNAAVLEEAAFLAYHSLQLDPGIRPIR